MNSVFDLGFGPLIIALLVFPSGSAALMYWVTQRGPFAARLQQYHGVVAPYFMSVGILFAMFATFLGADIWERAKQSDQSLEREVSAIESINQIAAALGEAGRPIRTVTNRYVQATLDDELSRTHGSPSTVADQALADLVKVILDLPAAAGSIGVAQGAMLAGYGKISDARALRRHIARDHSDPHKWLIVIVLCSCLRWRTSPP
jgi:hypothetical protein